MTTHTAFFLLGAQSRPTALTMFWPLMVFCRGLPYLTR